MMVRPKDMSLLPAPEASVSERRRFAFRLLDNISKSLSAAGYAANVFDPSEQDAPDYTLWNVMMDGSLSKAHICDGFYPVEIVTPVLPADKDWARTIDGFWAAMHSEYEFRQDTTCGFHIHISLHNGRCCPLSRRDNITSFCNSNLRAAFPRRLFELHGPLVGIKDVFNKIDAFTDRDHLIDFICPSKHCSWNFLPAKTGKPGSIEFRRPPGVTSAKKAKHWIAFTMAFVWMSMKFSPQDFINELGWLGNEAGLGETLHPDFRKQLLKSAKEIGVFWHLDARLEQVNDPDQLHITMMTDRSFAWLQSQGLGYKWSVNRGS
ncbi:hypothetical protein V8F20_006355 [Naviculisporaceae sp. PSN 640]